MEILGLFPVCSTADTCCRAIVAYTLVNALRSDAVNVESIHQRSGPPPEAGHAHTVLLPTLLRLLNANPTRGPRAQNFLIIRPHTHPVGSTAGDRPVHGLIWGFVRRNEQPSPTRLA